MIEWYWTLTFLLGSLLVIMFAGVPVAFGFLAVNMIGAWVFLGGWAGLQQVAHNTVDGLVSFSLTPIPMFLLMGEVLFRTGVAARAIEAMDRLIVRVPGRLSLVAIAGGTVFAALSGSTVANTAMLGSVLLPDMRKRGYQPGIAMGPIMAVGGIAMLIPPSNLAVLLGSLSGISIADLLIGGIVPGLLMAACFFAYVIIVCTLNPSLAPSYPLPPMSFGERITPFVLYVAPLLLLFVIVVGSILAGVATPSESAALGAGGAVIAAACYRTLTWKALKVSLTETAKITVMIFIIIAASLSFSQILGFSGATTALVRFIGTFDLSPLMILCLMLAILLVLGCFMDQLSMMMITLPLFMPLARAAELDVVWFGILMLLSLEIGLITPPFGLVLFCMKGVAPSDISMRQIYAAVTPFIVIEVILLATMVAAPRIVTWLPALTR
jgi:tripartite ATP-independent transporter DctM subunit